MLVLSILYRLIVTQLLVLIYSMIYICFLQVTIQELNYGDTRNMSCSIQENIGSQKKWDEAICDSVFIPEIMALATAGADSSIKMFKL